MRTYPPRAAAGIAGGARPRLPGQPRSRWPRSTSCGGGPARGWRWAPSWRASSAPSRTSRNLSAADLFDQLRRDHHLHRSLRRRAAGARARRARRSSWRSRAASTASSAALTGAAGAAGAGARAAPSARCCRFASAPGGASETVPLALVGHVELDEQLRWGAQPRRAGGAWPAAGVVPECRRPGGPEARGERPERAGRRRGAAARGRLDRRSAAARMRTGRRSRPSSRRARCSGRRSA